MAAGKIEEAGPQEEHVDDQNLDIDIKKIYNSYIVEIDNIRSHVSVYNNPTYNDFSKVKAENFSPNATIEKKRQESRCSAFYRLLGLPVTDGVSLYTPGFDLPNNSNVQLNDSKIKIAQKLFDIDGVKDFLNIRENFPKNYEPLFSKQGVDSMVLAMSSAEIRAMNISFSNTPSIFSLDKEQDYKNLLGSRLIKTVKNNGESPNENLLPSNLHVLTPLVVDPRVDFNVYPKRNRLAVPFLNNLKDASIAENVFLKKPYIEKVCRERFDIRTNSAVDGYAVSKIINAVKSVDTIKDNELIKKVFFAKNFTSDTAHFIIFFNSIRCVLSRLHESVMKITPVLAADPFNQGMASYNWTPIPNADGLEFGCTTRLIFDQVNDLNNTQQDKELISMLYKQELDNITKRVNNIGSPDSSGTAFTAAESSIDSQSSDSMGDLAQSQINQAVLKRKKLCDAANDATQDIEIIMGNYSGLGLLDILVISAAFWVVDKKDLLGMLDDTAINRMLKDPNLKAPEVLERKSNPPVPGVSLLGFQNKVKEIYDICDSLWKHREELYKVTK